MWREGNRTKGRIILPGLPLNVEDIGGVCTLYVFRKQLDSEAVTCLHRGLGLRFGICDGTRFRSVTHTQGSPPLKAIRDLKGDA